MAYLPPNFRSQGPSEAEVSLASRGGQDPSTFGYLQAFGAERRMGQQNNQQYLQYLNALTQQDAQRQAAMKAGELSLAITKQANEPGSVAAISSSQYLAPFIQGMDLAPSGQYAGRAAEANIINKTMDGVAAGARSGNVVDQSYVQGKTGVRYLAGALPGGAGASNEKSNITYQVADPDNLGGMITVKIPPGVTDPKAYVDGLGLHSPTARVTNPPAATGQGTNPALNTYKTLPTAAQRDIQAAMRQRGTANIPVMQENGKTYIVGAQGRYEVR